MWFIAFFRAIVLAYVQEWYTMQRITFVHLFNCQCTKYMTEKFGGKLDWKESVNVAIILLLLCVFGCWIADFAVWLYMLATLQP